MPPVAMGRGTRALSVGFAPSFPALAFARLQVFNYCSIARPGARSMRLSLSSYWKLSYWFGERGTYTPPRSNKKEPFSNESLDFLFLNKLFSLDFLIRSLLILLK